jgi:hypothetical protein
MYKLVFLFLSLLFIHCQERLPKEQRTLENDPSFMRRFDVEVIKRDTQYNLYPKNGDKLLVDYHGTTLEGKV